MKDPYSLFESPAGPIALAWTEHGLAGVALPDGDGTSPPLGIAPDSRPARTVPGWVRRIARRLGRHLDGSPQSFTDVALDVSRLAPFPARVLKLVRGLVPGSVVSHAWLASRAKEPGATRAVSRAIAGNPWPVVVPCHRVVASGAHPGGYSGAGGLATKERLLAAEGVRLDRSVAAGG